MYFVWNSSKTKQPIIVIAKSVIANNELFEKHFPGQACAEGGDHAYYSGDDLRYPWNEAMTENKCYRKEGLPITIESDEDEALVLSQCPIIHRCGTIEFPITDERWAATAVPAKSNSQARSAAWGKDGYVAREGAAFEFL
jgi:hypothetical protein